MWNRLVFCFCCLVLCLLCSCSRITYLEVTTAPPEADITLNGVSLGQSPVIYQIPDKDFFISEHKIVAQKDGYSETFKKIDSYWWQDKHNLVKDLGTGRKGGHINIILLPQQNKN